MFEYIIDLEEVKKNYEVYFPNSDILSGTRINTKLQLAIAERLESIAHSLDSISKKLWGVEE